MCDMFFCDTIRSRVLPGPCMCVLLDKYLEFRFDLTEDQICISRRLKDSQDNLEKWKQLDPVV